MKVGVCMLAPAVVALSTAGCAEHTPAVVTAPSAPASAEPAATVSSAPSSDASVIADEARESGGLTCTAPCKGSITSELEQALALRAKKSHRCYDMALVQNPALSGRIALAVTIAEDGAVCESHVKSDSTGQAVLAECVRRVLVAAQPPLPAPAGGCIEVTVPISFVPGTAATDAGAPGAAPAGSIKSK